MRFYLGAEHADWLRRFAVPMMVSRRTLAGRKTFPRALSAWVLDSGGFSELTLTGGWLITAAEYARTVLRIADEVGRLEWAAPQDWMTEPAILARTGKTVEEHQRLTLENFLELRPLLGATVIPVLQGWRYGDHVRHAEMYERSGVDLHAERVVGIGSVCRRQNTEEVAHIVRSVRGLRLHGFGVKLGGVVRLADELASSDSMAWSYAGRRAGSVCGTHTNEAHCPVWAMAWRDRLLCRIEQPRQTAMAI